ncbi:MAG: hypothetical protein R3E90_02530 [Marinicella sp.]
MNYTIVAIACWLLDCQKAIKQTLNKQQAAELTTLMARLSAVLGINEQTALVVCAAAFSSEQLLQPKFPVQLNINQYAHAAFQVS